MKQLIIPFFISALFTMPLLAEACAMPGPGMMGGGLPMLENMDANGDGKVSKAEFNAAHATHMQGKFDYLDANKDGFITAEDHELRRRQHAEAAFAKADANGDGALSKDEYMAARSARSAAHADANSCDFKAAH